MKREYTKPELEFVSFLADEELLAPTQDGMGWDSIPEDEEGWD